MTLETFTLVKITDIRPLDWETGKRLPVDAGELAECGRCGRRHAEVWRLRSSLGRALTVGSGCGPRLLAEGLLPGVDLPAVKAAKRAAGAEVRRIRRAGAEARALELARLARAADAAAGSPPAPIWGADRYGRTDFATLNIGQVFRCAVTRGLDRAALERMTASEWHDAVRMTALTEAGCPRRALYSVCRLSNAETEMTLRDAAAALLP
jgi:hypothetical protein